MKKQRSEYRKSIHSTLKKDWYGVPKLEGGPYWPICNCCNGTFGPIHYKKNKKLMHRYIRHRNTQNWMQEAQMVDFDEDREYPDDLDNALYEMSVHADREANENLERAVAGLIG